MELNEIMGKDPSQPIFMIEEINIIKCCLYKRETKTLILGRINNIISLEYELKMNHQILIYPYSLYKFILIF